MRRGGVVLAGVLLLTSCSSTVAGSAMPKAGGSTLLTMLSRVPAADLGRDGYFEFADSAGLRKLAGTDPALWKNEVDAGSSDLSSYAAYTVATVGVDLSTADSALTVGQPPASVTLVAGGQDASKISAAAKKSGWTGGGVLSRRLDLDNISATAAGIALIAPKIRPVGSDVVLSLTDGDPAGIAAGGATVPSPADQLPGLKATIACLGQVSTAAGSDLASANASAWTAVGAGAGAAGTASSVICLGAADATSANTLAGSVRSALGTGRSKLSRQRWAELLKSAKVDLLPGSPTMVRVTAGTATADLVRRMLVGRDIPGR